MHKLFTVRVVTAVTIFIIAALGVAYTGADNSSPWINSALSVQKQADVATQPASIYGNIDCAADDGGNCAVPTLYGAAGSNSIVRLNGDGGFFPVYTYLENRQRFFPVPNSSMAISYTTSPVYGFNLYFNYNFASSITRSGGLGTLLPIEYHINRPPDGKLTDKANHLLAADIASVSFSQNGRWMVVSDPNVAMLRIDLQTFSVVPFAPDFNYSIGLDPAIKTAITNDGRYAVVASKNFSTFKIYDLNTCGSVPDSINGPITCQSRDLNSFMQQQVSGYSQGVGFIVNARFMDDDALAVYGVYKPETVNKTARFIISSGDISPQTDYMALGDSYISGEGAFDYAGGTDTADNHCHLSYLSYPFLIGKDLNYNSYHSVACSGAQTRDITETSGNYIGQADADTKLTRDILDKANLTQTYLSSFTPGHLDQLDFVKTYQPKAVTVSIGGNDVNMIGSLKSCFKPDTCFSTYEDRLEFVHSVNRHFSDIVDTYKKIKNAGPPDMRIYAIGYPQIAKPDGDCALNVHLNNDEITFTTQAIDYLDTVIKTAAAKAGVFYVDAENALDSHRLCEAGPGSVAMNGITAGNDIPKNLGGPIGNESFHPNVFGYQLLENSILAATKNLTAPMPSANPNVSLPSEDNLPILDAPHTGRSINTTEFDPSLAPDLAYRGTPVDISINGTAHALSPNTTLTAELHSTPVNLGSFTTNTTGDLSTQVNIPGDTPTGYHTLHFYGTDINGQPVDIYKDIYVANTADDLDGDGIPDSTQKCVGIMPSGQDFDQDGIDDACDGTIGLAPPAPAQSPPTANPSIDSGQVNSSFVLIPTPVAQHSSALTYNPSTADPSNAGASQNLDTPHQAVLAADTKVTAPQSSERQPQNRNSKNRSNSYIYLTSGFSAIVIISYIVKTRLF